MTVAAQPTETSNRRKHLLILIGVLGAALLAAVILLIVRWDNGSSSTTTPETAAPSAAAVTDLQTVMTKLGFYSGPIDGVYGSATQAGVTEMQTKLGVTADGVYGPETQTALKSKAHDVVVQIQTSLATYGYYTGPIDGVYGPATVDAVKKLQTDLGVEVDGRFGEATAKAFDEAVANGTLKPV